MTDALPKHLPVGTGTIYQLGRLTLTVKISDAAYTLCEAIEPPGWSAALHRHATYDETHIICEGRYECQLGDQRLEMGPGDMMYAPAGTPHSIKNVGGAAGRELVVSSPGRIFDAFIAEAAEATDPGRAAKLGPGTDFRAIAAKYGIEFLA
jgi:mannose-6-phosphate isomerase-like protein (cupin superfamily)